MQVTSLVQASSGLAGLPSERGLLSSRGVAKGLYREKELQVVWVEGVAEVSVLRTRCRGWRRKTLLQLVP